MPSVTIPFSAFGQNLSSFGPLVKVGIGISAPRMAALHRSGLPIPPMRPANFLLDTGADLTTIDKTILQGLNLVPTGSTSILTPSTQNAAFQVNTYDVSLLINGVLPMMPLHLSPALAVLEGDFHLQAIDGLLGRDILSHCHITYSGQMSMIILSS